MFLKRIINSADKVIINGDFWDDSVENERFMASEWKRLFPLLKRKKTIYVHGNHDLDDVWSGDPKAFCEKSCHEYSFKSGHREFIVTHGHSLLPGSTSQEVLARHSNPLTRPFWKMVFMLPKRMRKLVLVLRLERIPLFFTRGRFYERFRFLNDKMKEATKNIRKEKVLICGHSHSQEIDIDSNYVNTGFINYGIGQYAVINDGNIQIKDERY